MELAISIMLALIGPLHRLWVKLQRWRTLRSGTPPVAVTFKPTHWESPQGVLAMVPVSRPDLVSDASEFDAPRSWLTGGAFLTDTAFLLEIENNSTDDFPRTVIITEMIARITRAQAPEEANKPQRILCKWSPAAVGPLYEIDDPEHPRILPRVIHVRTTPELPVMLMHAMVGPLPPPGGYRLRTGSRFVFVFRFEFDAAGEYEVHIALAVSESGEARRTEVISGLTLLQLPNVGDIFSEVQHLVGTEPASCEPTTELMAALAESRERIRRAVSPAAPTDSNPAVAVVPHHPDARVFPGLH